MATLCSRLLRSLFFLAVLASGADGRAGVVVLENAYAGVEDSPFRDFGERLIVEDFEDREFDLPGVNLSERVAFLLPRVIQSTDGAVSIDPGGHSLGPYYETATPTIPRQHQSHIRFAFDASFEDLLQFGFVVTTMALDTRMSLTAFGLDGEPVLQSDWFLDVWSDPLFLGVTSDVPLSSVEISAHARGHETYFQVDHVQIVVPEPATMVLLAMGASFALVFWRRQVHCRGSED